MPGWGAWVLLGLVACFVVSLLVLRVLRLSRASDQWAPGTVASARGRSLHALAPPTEHPVAGDRRHVLVVDDDAGLRLLLRTTLAADEFAVEEAVSAEEAAAIARFWSPAVVILDIGLPGMDGLTFCSELKRNPAYGSPLVILLTGLETSAAEVAAAGPDAVLRKPFSPLELITLLGRVVEPVVGVAVEPAATDAEQLLMYARDLNTLLEVERAQRRLLQRAYRQTATALADALEARDPVTGLHALRVQRYALELSGALDRSLLDDPSLEYGFLLHDVGKLGIPDAILQKEGPLSSAERRVMERHPLIGMQMLSEIALLQGEGLRVVRSHHERWDGTGYPDRLAGRQIPLAARIFALVDAVDAMTSERPYRTPLEWDKAVEEILAQKGRQFDPQVVAMFAARELRMRTISEQLAETAA